MSGSSTRYANLTDIQCLADHGQITSNTKIYFVRLYKGRFDGYFIDTTGTKWEFSKFLHDIGEMEIDAVGPISMWFGRDVIRWE